MKTMSYYLLKKQKPIITVGLSVDCRSHGPPWARRTPQHRGRAHGCRSRALRFEGDPRCPGDRSGGRRHERVVVDVKAEAQHEVPSGARRARRCGGVDGQEPAQSRPSVPVLAGVMLRVADGQPARLRLRLRGLQPGHRRGAGRRRRRRPGLRSAARRDHQGAAGQAGGHRRGRLAPRAGLRQRPLHPADHAGRGLPDACRRCRPAPAPSTPPRSPPPSPRSRSPPAATRRCR